MIPSDGVDLQEEAKKLKANIKSILAIINKVQVDIAKSSNHLIGLYYAINDFNAHVADMQAVSVSLADIAPYVQRYKGNWSSFQADFTTLNGTALPELKSVIESVEDSILSGSFGPTNILYSDMPAGDVTTLTPKLQAVKSVLS